MLYTYIKFLKNLWSCEQLYHYMIISSQCVHRLEAKILISQLPSHSHTASINKFYKFYLQISNQTIALHLHLHRLKSGSYHLPDYLTAANKKFPLVLPDWAEMLPLLRGFTQLSMARLSHSNWLCSVALSTQHPYNIDYPLLQCCKQKYTRHMCNFKCSSSLMKKVKRN